MEIVYYVVEMPYQKFRFLNAENAAAFLRTCVLTCDDKDDREFFKIKVEIEHHKGGEDCDTEKSERD